MAMRLGTADLQQEGAAAATERMPRGCETAGAKRRVCVRSVTKGVCLCALRQKVETVTG